MTTDERRPNPGSAEAVAAGCICAVIDNHRGRGIPTKGLEAAHDAVRDALGYRHGNMVNLGGVHIDFRNVAQAAIEAYLRAASNDAEPVAWTSSGNLDGLRDHDSLVIGSMCNRQGDGWTVPLYLTAIEPVAASPGVPDGWRLVPVEPTEAMMRAAMDRLGWTTRPTPPEYENFGSARISDGLSEEDAAQIDGELAMEFREVYRAVLAAAPASPEPSPASEDAQARIETLERALRQVREAITAPVNALAITDTVWMPLPQNAASSIETMVDFIDAALSPSTNGAEK